MATRLIFAILAGTALAANAQTPIGSNGAADYLRQGEKHFAAFRYPDAARTYSQILVADSTHYYALKMATESWNLHGLDQQAARQKDSAEVAFERAVVLAERSLRHYPDSADTWVNLAAAWGNLALFKGGKDKVRIGQQVEDYGNRALEIDSTHVIALSILGVFYREVSKLSWIERVLAKAIYGGVPDGSIEQSVAYLQRAIEADSLALFPTYSLAVTYRHMKEHELAQELLDRVVAMRSANSEESRYQFNARRWLAEYRDS